jgi:hypothetical protein
MLSPFLQLEKSRHRKTQASCLRTQLAVGQVVGLSRVVSESMLLSIGILD